MSNLELAVCFIGKHLNEKCHVKTLTRTVGFKQFSELKYEDQKILKWRCEFVINDESQICFHHEHKFIYHYEKFQQYCANPFKKHKKIVKSK